MLTGHVLVGRIPQGQTVLAAELWPTFQGSATTIYSQDQLLYQSSLVQVVRNAHNYSHRYLAYHAADGRRDSLHLQCEMRARQILKGALTNYDLRKHRPVRRS